MGITELEALVGVGFAGLLLLWLVGALFGPKLSLAEDALSWSLAVSCGGALLWSRWDYRGGRLLALSALVAHGAYVSLHVGNDLLWPVIREQAVVQEFEAIGVTPTPAEIANAADPLALAGVVFANGCVTILGAWLVCELASRRVFTQRRDRAYAQRAGRRRAFEAS